jgi:hypothetical protein
MAVTSPESPSPQQPYGPNDVPTIQPALSPAPSYMPGATPTAGYGPPYASQPWALQQRPPQPKTNWKLLALIVGALVVIGAALVAVAVTSKIGNDAKPAATSTWKAAVRQRRSSGRAGDHGAGRTGQNQLPPG